LTDLTGEEDNMTDIPHTVDTLQQNLGRYVRSLRLARNLSVEKVAETTALAEKSVRNLESGRGSTTETLFKVLTAVEASRLLKILTPAEAPAALDSKHGPVVRVRQRARRTPSRPGAAK
jgi:transcriptional regulator with XRE-family HTH domain